MMNSLIVLMLSLAALPAFSADWEVLRDEASERFVGQYFTPELAGDKPVSLTLPDRITKVVVNRTDNPAQKVNHAMQDATAGIFGTDLDTVEIFIYSGNYYLNCYATFEDAEFQNLFECKKRKKLFSPD
jgi:hypothetical protein